MEQNKVIATLNELIENCKDGEYGFTRAANYTLTETLKKVFKDRAENCHMAARELQQLVEQLGGKFVDDGTVAGAAHRSWVAVKGTVAGYSDLGMLDEAERGEDMAVERYRMALGRDLPPDVRLVVQQQFEGAKRNLLQIRTLRDQAKAVKV